MKKTTWLWIIAIVAAVGLWSAKLLVKEKVDDKDKSNISKADTLTYWTCPMHPQIHSDKAGECPICHMKLVQVKAQGSHTGHGDAQESRAMVNASPYQTQLLGIQKVVVEQMDLALKIPISGRFVSSMTVAFQVYESDVRYIKSGLTFHGSSRFMPESDIVGTISSVDSIVDPTSRTVRVLGQIKKGPKGQVAETTFSGEVEIVLKQVTAVPESAVLHTGSEDIVYLIHDDGSLMAQPIKLGEKANSYYEVIEGLSPGQAISSGPNFLIDSEAKIRGVGGGASGHTHN